MRMIDEDEVGLKKNPKTLDLIPNFVIVGTADSGSAGASRLKVPSGGGGGSRPVVAYNQVLNVAPPPPDPRRRCSKFFNLNGWTSFCYQDRIFYSWQRGANCALCLRSYSRMYTKTSRIHSMYIMCPYLTLKS